MSKHCGLYQSYKNPPLMRAHLCLGPLPCQLCPVLQALLHLTKLLSHLTAYKTWQELSVSNSLLVSYNLQSEKIEQQLISIWSQLTLTRQGLAFLALSSLWQCFLWKYYLVFPFQRPATMGLPKNIWLVRHIIAKKNQFTLDIVQKFRITWQYSGQPYFF